MLEKVVNTHRITPRNRVHPHVDGNSLARNLLGTERGNLTVCKLQIMFRSPHIFLSVLSPRNRFLGVMIEHNVATSWSMYEVMQPDHAVNC